MAEQVTQLPVALHTMLAPHIVPLARLPDSMQTGEPVAHDVAPVLQGLVGWQLAPAEQLTHVPALQTRSVPHWAPLGSELPVSVQPIVGAQTVTPAWHGLVGWQSVPTEHAAQAPLAQTMSEPHGVPFGWLPASMQTGVPVLQAIVPRLQGLPGTLQVMPATHAPQAPFALQTMSAPQLVPAATLVFASMQVGAAPEQTSFPL